MNKITYYVEVYEKGGDYVFQSKEFEDKDEAKSLVFFVREDYGCDLMRVTHYEDGDFDIDVEENIK